MAGSPQVVVITGASSGIGRALAVELATRGNRLVLAARDVDRLSEVAGLCQQHGAETLVVPTDVTRQDQCQRLIEEAAGRFDRIDVLVNNAGRAMWSRFDLLDDLRVIEEIMQLNFMGGVYCTRHALPHLERSRGLIVAMASLSGLIGVPMLTGYAASKHAMIGFYESLRIEMATRGVGVTIVAPDYVQSEVLERAMDRHGQSLGHSPLDQKKMPTAQACARRVVRAMARRERLVLTSFRSGAARWGQLLAPKLVDWFTSSAQAR